LCTFFFAAVLASLAALTAAHSSFHPQSVELKDITDVGRLLLARRSALSDGWGGRRGQKSPRS